MAFKKIFLLSLPVLLMSSLSAQELVFNAYLGDDHIGTMTVTRTETASGVVYTSVTDITVTYILSMDLDLSYSAHYVDGQLTKTSFKYQRNHKTKEYSYGQVKGSTFSTYFDDRTEHVLIKNINQTLTASYFAEPTQLNEVFSERWGVNISLVSLGNSKYKITLPDGKESYMTYANGLCRESRIVSGWGDIVFRR
ncbi:MAG: DUF6134 family protein [Lewinella sp.]|jgi:hypothetical protein|uniref:DUF6134 family protein n=1 Tax=Lewinella sp. TaxID=2004506 RepID=UPI003D6A70CD